MELTIQEVWTEFIYGLHQTGKWETLTRAERQALDKTNRLVKYGCNPVLRVCNAFNKYSPGVYTLNRVVFVRA